MPSPATNRASGRGGNATTSNSSSKANTKKPLDIGKPLGVHDTNSVRAKVRKWQQEGGGVVVANDAVYYEEDEENASAVETSLGISTPPRGRASHSSKARSSSTPRKRVISDEHWKLNRNAANRGAPQAKAPSPNKRVAEYTSNDPIESPRREKKDDGKEDRSKPSPISRSRERNRVGAPPETLRGHRKSKSTSRDLDMKFSEHHDSSRHERAPSRSRARDASKSTPDLKPVNTERRRPKSMPPEGDAERADRVRRSVQVPEAANSANKNHTPLKAPPKGGIFTHMLGESKKMFARPEPPKPKGSRIEAWLSDTPDPFLRDAESVRDGESVQGTESVQSDVEIPPPLKMKASRARRTSRLEETRDRATDSELSLEDRSRPRSAAHRRSRNRDELLSEREKSRDRPSVRDRDRDRDRDTTPSPSGRRPKSSRRSKSPSHVDSEPSEKLHEEENTEAGETESHVYSEGSEVSGDNPPVPLGRKRAFPSTGGKRLPTIASMESITTHEPSKPEESQQPEEPQQPEDPQEPPKPTEKAPAEEEKPDLTKEKEEEKEAPEAEERDQFDPNSLPMVTSQLRRRLTTHDDLISVLSTNTRSRSLKSARSLRVNKGSATTATVNDLLRELAADETKYMRELKTLVGGVIPVLLTCVLSGSDSAAAAGLFRPSADPQDEANFTKPIVDMGVAIERLKTLHKRIPQDHADALLTWSGGAQRVYRDYLKAWRLGFKDVIVNLAPLDEQEAAKGNSEDGNEHDNSDKKSLDEGMARDENGDIVDGEGEKVDVAYLLKRPLVRLKYLSKTFKGISIVQPSPKADEVASSYQALVTEARRRAREERARLEDEAASSIDATRARDPATLGALPGVMIDKTRRVRARDFFGLTLYHSSGQVVDCRVELLMRDNAPVYGGGGDLLICEVDHSDRWLLFPPIDFGCVSARTGDVKGDLIVMIRSVPGHARAWQEVILLHIDEEEVAFEWVQLLGLQPVPPSISRNQSFVDRARQRQQQLLPPPEKKPEEQGQEGPQDNSPANTLALVQAPPPSPSHLDVPIGEKATSRTARLSLTPKEDPSTAESSAGESRASTAITRESDYADRIATASPQPLILHARDPRATTPADSPGLKRSKAKRMSRVGDSPSPSPGPSPKKDPASEKKPSPSTPYKEHNGDKRGVLSPTPARETHPNEQKQLALPKTPTRDADDGRPSSRLSSVPSVELPSIPKLRSGSSYTRLSEPLDLQSDEDDDDDISLDPSELPESPTRRKSDDSSEHDDGDEPPPPPPPHRSPSSTLSGPVLNPSAPTNRRRGSSPLKHEYEPSMESEESYTDSDTSTVRRYDMDSASEYSVSDSSDDESEDELASTVQPSETPERPKVTEKASIVPSGSSLTPSHSASQGGYRSVPPQPTKSSRVMAAVFAWSNRGTWESLLSDECLLIVSPGLIEAYEMSVAPPESEEGTGKPNKGRPMVGLELTPLVPIRRGTAIDISIRSPPTERSKITWSNNIMFRSRTPEECEALYGLINGSRINNPTYIALQNARGPYAEQRMPLESSNKSGGGMFGWPRRRKSYRASPASPRSLAEHSESSVGTMSSAFSALKRFGNGSKMFNITRSTVTSRSGQPEEGSLHSADTGAHSAGSGIGRIAAAIKGVDGIGLSNAKIRLYMRETQTKWRDMGAARLTIMPATDGTDKAASGPPQSSASSSTTRAVDSHEPRKRILIHGKTRNEVLLDVSLGESSFERVARTGIAVSVWEEKSATSKDSIFGGNSNGSGSGGGGGMPERGGVTGGTYRIYMVQMKSEAEAAYTFGLVGKLKY